MMRHSLILAALLLTSVETTDVNAQEAPADTMGQGQSHAGGSMMGCGMGGHDGSWNGNAWTRHDDATRHNAHDDGHDGC
jgi:hypothetical protein